MQGTNGWCRASHYYIPVPNIVCTYIMYIAKTLHITAQLNLFIIALLHHPNIWHISHYSEWGQSKVHFVHPHFRPSRHHDLTILTRIRATFKELQKCFDRHVWLLQLQYTPLLWLYTPSPGCIDVYGIPSRENSRYVYLYTPSWSRDVFDIPLRDTSVYL